MWLNTKFLTENKEIINHVEITKASHNVSQSLFQQKETKSKTLSTKKY